MDDFFSHEILKYLSSLSKRGETCSGIKSELMKCIEMLPTSLPGTEASRRKSINEHGEP